MLQRDPRPARQRTNERRPSVNLESVKAALAAFCGTHLKMGAGFLASIKDDNRAVTASLGVVRASAIEELHVDH